MVKKLSLKKRLIAAVTPIPMDSTRKENLIHALKMLKEPIPRQRLSAFFTLLDLNSAVQGNSFSSNPVEEAKSWQPALQLYKEYNLDKPLELSNKEAVEFIQMVDSLIEYHQIKPFKLTPRSSKR